MAVGPHSDHISLIGSSRQVECMDKVQIEDYIFDGVTVPGYTKYGSGCGAAETDACLFETKCGLF